MDPLVLFLAAVDFLEEELLEEELLEEVLLFLLEAVEVFLPELFLEEVEEVVFGVSSSFLVLFFLVEAIWN